MEDSVEFQLTLSLSNGCTVLAMSELCKPHNLNHDQSPQPVESLAMGLWAWIWMG